MKVKQKKLDDGKVLLECIADQKEVVRALDKAAMGFARQMRLAPQQGKTIAQVAQESMGIRDLDSVVEAQAIEYMVPFALSKARIVPAYPPTGMPAGAMRRGRDFAFRVTVMPKPEFELKSYEPVEITVPAAPTVAPEVVEQRIAQMIEPYGRYVDSGSEGPVGPYDNVLIAIKATSKGEEMRGLSTTGRTYVLGQGYMPGGFDENVEGMMVGETKTFTIEAPDYSLDGLESTVPVECTVTVKQIQKRTVPQLDEEFIKMYMPMYKDVEAFRNQIEHELTVAQKTQYEQYVQQVAVRKLMERFEGTIADPVYEHMQNRMMNELRQNLQAQGQSLDDFIENNGGQQQFQMMMLMQIRETLIQNYCLDAIFRHQGLVIRDEDLEEVCAAMLPPMETMDPMQQLMGNVPTTKSIRKNFEENGQSFILRESAERLRANKWLVEHAKVTYEDVTLEELAAEAASEAQA